jgi:glucosyl-dolichyl phosphate glucuronosyltransferase
MVSGRNCDGALRRPRPCRRPVATLQPYPSLEMSLEISVVICAHDSSRWTELGAALASVEEQTLKPHEIIVVVDHNDDLLHRVRAELGVPAIENSQTRGLGGARNSGFAASSGSVVAFLDDDAVASPEWLSRLAERYGDPTVAAVGGSAEPLWAQGRPPWFPREFDWVVGCSYLGMPETSQEVRNLFGCNMSFRRQMLSALGGFRLGYGCDETEFCIRLRQRWPEQKVLYVPEAKIFHRVPEHRTHLRRFLSRCYFEGGSKAVVSRLVGAGQALSSEYRYTREVLPLGVRRGLGEFVRGGDISGLARAATVIAGLLTATAGYAAATVATTKAARVRGWSGPL